MPEMDEIIRPFYEKVPLEDDYHLQTPESIKLEENSPDILESPEMQAENKVRKDAPRRLDGDVLIIGAGITGMQAALDIGDKGYRVIMIDKSSTIGCNMVKLDKTFPTNDCSICTCAPKWWRCPGTPTSSF